MKAFDKIRPCDLALHPVWEFCNEMEDSLGDETFLRVVEDLPVDSLANRIVGTELNLANGSVVFGILQNIELYDHYQTEHFVTVTVFDKKGRSFPLARYHDVAIETYGPDALARFLRLKVADVFPLSYDISAVAIGDLASVRRKIPIRPRNPLTRSDLIRLAVG